MFCSKKKKKSCWQLFFPLLHSVISAVEERDRMKGTLDTLSFLVLPTKRRPPWPFGYCKISNSVFYLAHLFRNNLQGPRRSARTSDSLRFFFALCRPRCCLTKPKSKSIYPRRLWLSKRGFNPRDGSNFSGCFQHEQSIFLFFVFLLSLFCIPNIINSPLFTQDERDLVFL